MMAAADNDSDDQLVDDFENLSVEKHTQSLFHDLTPPAHIYRGQMSASIPNVCGPEAFCAAFYHVYEHGGRSSQFEYECLNETGCRFTVCERPKVPKKQHPKDVALLAVLQGDDQQIIWISSFTNCCQCIYDMHGRNVKKHAEDFLLEDATSNNKNSLGSVLKGFQSSDRKSRVLTLYITYQPCHESAENSLQKSCTETVKKLYNEHLKPKGVKLIIKPTHIFKAYWDDEENEVRNAKHGMRRLADFQIAEKGKFSVEAMTEDDWKLLMEAFGIEMQFDYEKSQRWKLDKFIDKELKDVLNKANKDAEVKKVMTEGRAEDKDESKDDEEEEHSFSQKGKGKKKIVVKKKDQGDKM